MLFFPGEEQNIFLYISDWSRPWEGVRSITDHISILARNLMNLTYHQQAFVSLRQMKEYFE